ncbi:MAG: cell wall-binding repeat-containing protein [Coriobacteriia bacterium]|nr:cell wall-binding repeat-containing protein [Coriobacteriia bacterium]
MKHTYHQIAFLAMVLTVMLLGGSASGLGIILPSVDWTPAVLANSDTVDEDTATLDGDLVAYEYGDQVRVTNIRLGVTRTIPDPGGTQAKPDVSGDRVVYQDNGSGNWDIKMYQWTANTSSDVRATDADEIGPRIDGNLVVWWDDTNADLWSRNYDMGGYTAAQISNGVPAALYDVDNGRCALVTYESTLYIRNLAPTGTWTLLRTFTETVDSIEMHGSRVAVGTVDAGDYNVVTCSTADGALSDVATSSTLQERNPSIFHNGVTWRESTNGLIGSDIGYGFPGPSIFQTPGFGSTTFDQEPSIYGHRIAFHGLPLMGDSDVYLATSDTKLQSRSSGTTRYATAAAASSAYFSTAHDVVLCNGRKFPDALSAAPLAKALDAPLLLTDVDALPPETAIEIARLGTTKIWVIGGTSVISTAVYNQLDLTYDIERIAGASRYETSAEVALRHKTIVGPEAVSRAFFASGENYPDALAAGPVAAAANSPVLLVQNNAVPDPIASAVDDLDITIGYVIGGTSVVSSATDTALRSLITANGGVGTITERWAGTDRYSTAATVVQKGLDYRWIDLDTVGFATGQKFPDALGAGAAMGYYGSPLLLTNGTALSPATETFLDSHRYQVGRVNVFGGVGVVSDAVLASIIAKVP